MKRIALAIDFTANTSEEKGMGSALPAEKEWTRSATMSTLTVSTTTRTAEEEYEYFADRQLQQRTTRELFNDTLMLLDNTAIISGDDISIVDGIKTNLIFGNRTNSSQIFNTTLAGNRSEDESDTMTDTFASLVFMLNFYYTPILVCTGSLGNILSVCVFFKTKLRKLSSSIYLAALAVSDTCFLLGFFIQWLNMVEIHIYNREFFCQFFTFFTNLACFCSAWFVVGFTVERFIAVGYPLRRQTMCTVRRAKIVIFALTAWGCVHCTPYWILSTTFYSPKLDVILCDMNTDYKDFMTVMNYYDTLMVFAVPFVIIFVLNTITGCRVWKFATARRSLTMQKRQTQQCPRDKLSTSTYHSTSLKSQKSTCSYHTSQNNVNQVGVRLFRRKSDRRKITNSSQLKVTKMLLIVSTVFVCLNLPSCVMRIKTYLETQTLTNENTTVLWQYIFQLPFITNFGLNFVLYCVSGQNFRKAVLSMFRRVSSSTHREGTTQLTGTASMFSGTSAEFGRLSRGTSLSKLRQRLGSLNQRQIVALCGAALSKGSQIHNESLQKLTHESVSFSR